MNQITAPPELLVRQIPLDRLVLAPENVRKTPPDKTAQAELEASIHAHGLLENLVVRADDSRNSGNSGKSGKSGNTKSAKGKADEKFAVVAGGRRLLALEALAKAGALSSDHPIPCRIAQHENLEELSLAENVVRIAMHPADQVVSFARLMRKGASVGTIAARFGVSERTVEQRLRLGNAAPELLDAYRAGEMDLAALKAFSMTADHERQRTVWKQLSNERYAPSEWQIRRLLTEERVSSTSAVARFVGIDEYVAAGGPVMRDLFAEEGESGEWLEDPALLNDLAMKKLQAAADELSTRWKWALPLLEMNWTSAYEFGQINPQPGKPTAKETIDLADINGRMDELAEIPDDQWTDKLEAEAEKLEGRMNAIMEKVGKRAKFRREDFAIGGCIVTIDREGKLQVVQGLVKIEDLPVPEENKDGEKGGNDPDAADEDNNHITPPSASPKSANPSARAREEAGVGIGLADDLRAIRAGIVKVHLAEDFEAAFDLAVFQAARAVFDRSHAGGRDALDISFRPTAKRPPVRMNHEDFGCWSPAEDSLDDWSSLPLRWMEEEDDGARFAALSKLPRDKKEKLFAAAVARTVRGQLSFEYYARPELEATVARLDIDFAKEVRPTADLLWSRLRKDHLLAIAGKTLGGTWAQDRSKYRKADLAMAMEKAFSNSTDGEAPAGVTPAQHAAALAWSMPGFAPFEAGSLDPTESVTDGEPATEGQTETHEKTGTDTATEESPAATGDAGNNLRVVNGSGPAEQDDAGSADTDGDGDGAEETVPGFLQAVH